MLVARTVTTLLIASVMVNVIALWLIERSLPPQTPDQIHIAGHTCDPPGVDCCQARISLDADGAALNTDLQRVRRSRLEPDVRLTLIQHKFADRLWAMHALDEEFYTVIERCQTKGATLALGDCNARIHGRRRGEEGVLGPRLYGRHLPARGPGVGTGRCHQ